MVTCQHERDRDIPQTGADAHLLRNSGKSVAFLGQKKPDLSWLLSSGSESIPLAWSSQSRWPQDPARACYRCVTVPASAETTKAPHPSRYNGSRGLRVGGDGGI